jgi:hypothetical protein
MWRVSAPGDAGVVGVLRVEGRGGDTVKVAQPWQPGWVERLFLEACFVLKSGAYFGVRSHVRGRWLVDL